MAAGLAGMLTVAGCDLDWSAAGGTAEPTTAPTADADSGLVEQVQQQILDASTRVGDARRASPDLRRRLRPLADLHEAHLHVFEGPPAEPATGRSSLEKVRSAESTLQRQLVDAAVAAESGALAKLLASMAAAVAQELAVLA